MATRRFIMQKARRHTQSVLRPLVGARFQELFHSSDSKCFSPFPHGTGTLSVSQEYLALPDGPGRFAQDFSCPALLRIPLGRIMLRVRDYHPLWTDFPDSSAHIHTCHIVVLQPRRCIATTPVWALPRSLATTGGIIVYFLFLRVLRCFSSPG